MFSWLCALCSAEYRINEYRVHTYSKYGKAKIAVTCLFVRYCTLRSHLLKLNQPLIGLHYLQEDRPDVIGANIKEWLIELGIGSSPKQKLAL
jgi:hypothetical protein